MKSPADPRPVNSGKSRGRPRVEEPGTPLTVWVPCSQYDRLVKLANNQNESLSALVRGLLVLQLKK